MNHTYIHRMKKMRIFHSVKRFFSKEKKNSNPLILISNNQNIYFNISLENFILNHYKELPKYVNTESSGPFEEPVLYLWRNDKSIILGKNQNVWSECNIDNIKKDDVLIARRFSGGGAVYHDLGNLCFTFLNPQVNTSNNFTIVLNALKKHFGIDANAQGRNDICVQNKKISGSAFKTIKDVFLHHGTILINLNREVLSSYLTPDKTKYIKHGASSVNARTVNLQELNEKVNHENMCLALIEEFIQFYNNKSNQSNSYNLISSIPTKQNNQKELVNTQLPILKNLNIHVIDTNNKIVKDPNFLKYLNLLKDWDWCYGKTPLFKNRIAKTFPFGKFEICFNVSDGMIKDGNIFSDSLDIHLIDELKRLFNNDLKYTKEHIKQFLQNIKVENKEYLNDITNWILKEM